MDDSNLESVQSFIETAQILFQQDDIQHLDQKQISKFLYHYLNKGKAYAALSEHLAFKMYLKSINISFYEELMISENFISFTPQSSIDGSSICEINLNLMSLVFKGKTFYKHLNAEAHGGGDIILSFWSKKFDEAYRLGLINDKITCVIYRKKSKEPSITLLRYIIPLYQKHYPEIIKKMIICTEKGAAIFMVSKNSALCNHHLTLVMVHSKSFDQIKNLEQDFLRAFRIYSS